MPEYAVVFTLSTDLPPHEAVQLAAELAAEAREHLLPGERIELAGVTAEPPATVPSACRV